MNHTPLRTLQAFLNNSQPTIEEAMEVFTPLAVGDYDDIHIAALLTHIRTCGETFADIAGAAKAFLRVGYPFPSPEKDSWIRPALVAMARILSISLRALPSLPPLGE